MNQDLENIKSAIEQSEVLGETEKEALLNSISAVDKELTIIEFKLERTEKVKRTTSVLLEETIDELEKKRADVEHANAALKKSLEDLKATQAQLIHSEKMASLGELTAGIAHEIQNPLNFVNNFSDVSKALIEELKIEREKVTVERDEKLEGEILNDIDQNLDKIHHHGIRASEIVKSMLQHSRTSTGEKEPTDLNALCDEYLRLAYHGMRAKEKSFNAEYKLELDPGLQKIKVVPQDIGRVLLNLINNAFQAVAEVENPKVTLITQQHNNSITIRVADNGPGIPEQVRDKIFQPFFTTKPTGQGTGLGLSLSYDIVKAHRGEILVESDPRKGTEFIIRLPFK
jgi:signal transduction histidine kinase